MFYYTCDRSFIVQQGQSSESTERNGHLSLIDDYYSTPSRRRVSCHIGVPVFLESACIERLDPEAPCDSLTPSQSDCGSSLCRPQSVVFTRDLHHSHFLSNWITRADGEMALPEFRGGPTGMATVAMAIAFLACYGQLPPPGGIAIRRVVGE